MADPKKNPLIGAFKTPPAKEEDKKAPTPPAKDEPKKPPETVKPKEEKKEAPPAKEDAKKPPETAKSKEETPPAKGTEEKKPVDPAKKDEPAKAPAPPAKDEKGKTPDPTPDAKASKITELSKADEKKPAEQTKPKEEAAEAEIPKDFHLNILAEGKMGTETMLPLELIDDFEGHPFNVNDDKDMEELVASIKQSGLLEPVTVIRNVKKPGRFEMVAGHRRKHAATRAGLTHVRALVRDMDHDEATIYMVDSNLKRENITPMEKARAIQMKSDALKRKAGRRTKEETKALEASGKKPLTTDEIIAKQTGESVATVQRFKQLNKLTPELQEKVDKKELPVNTAADIAQMKPEEQKVLADAMDKEAKVPSGAEAKKLKEASKAGTLTKEKIQAAVAPTKREEKIQLKVSFTDNELRPYFPDPETTPGQAKRIICEALELRDRALKKHSVEQGKAEKKKAATPGR